MFFTLFRNWWLPTLITSRAENRNALLGSYGPGAFGPAAWPGRCEHRGDTSEDARRIFCNDQWIVICDHSLERYVRTIESLHVYTKLVYLSRQVMDEAGRKLNAERGAKVEGQARGEIKSWEESRSRSDQAKQWVSRLSQIL